MLPTRLYYLARSIGEKYNTTSPALENLILQEFYSFNNLNLLLKRTVPFDTLGRMETEKQSDEDYVKMRNFLLSKNILFSDVQETEKTLQILNIMKNLGYLK